MRAASARTHRTASAWTCLRVIDALIRFAYLDPSEVCVGAPNWPRAIAFLSHSKITGLDGLQ